MSTVNRNHIASLLVKMTWMRDHQAFTTTDLEINVIDWKKIDSTDWKPAEKILIEFLRFIICGESQAYISSLNVLTKQEKAAVTMCLKMLYDENTFEDATTI